MAAFKESDEVPWEVRETEFKGKAAFALQNYKEGDCIYKEKPLVWVPFHWPFNHEQVQEVDNRIEALSKRDQAIFFDCANAYEDSDGLAPSIAAGIFYTNSFDMCGAHHGTSCSMYPNIARLNHSCSPNTRQEYCPETMRLLLFADQDISIGEQLTDSYTDITQPVDVRRKALLEFYRFHCDCEKCCREGCVETESLLSGITVETQLMESNPHPAHTTIPFDTSVEGGGGRRGGGGGNKSSGVVDIVSSPEELAAMRKKEAAKKKKAEQKMQKQRDAELFAKAKAEASDRKKKEKAKQKHQNKDKRKTVEAMIKP